MRLTQRFLWTTALVAALYGCSGETAEEHFANAEAYLAAGDANAAVLELKNALQKDQNLGAGRLLLGQIYLAEGDAPSAEKELQRAMWMEYEPSETLPAYARSLLLQQKWKEVLDLPEEALTDQALANLYLAKGMALIGQGKNSDAKETIDRALAIEPDSATARLAVAQLALNLGEVEEAAETLTELTELEPENTDALMALGNLENQRQDAEAASAAYDKVLAIDPDNRAAQQERVLLALQAGETQVAMRLSNQLLRGAPKDPGANFVRGILDLDAGRIPDAVRRLGLAEPIAEVYPSHAFFFGSAHLLDGNLEQANAYATRFNTLVPGSVRGRKLLATVRIEQGDFLGAEELMRPVVEQRPEDVAALKLMANSLLRQEKTDEGISMLARAAELEPESAASQIGLGAGLLIGGNPEDAALHIRMALEMDPQFEQGDLLLVMSLVAQEDFAAALETARNMQPKTPGDTTPANVLGWVQARSGDLDGARATYEEIIKGAPGDPSARHALARLAKADGDLETATGHYEAVLAEDDKSLLALVQLGLIAAEQDRGAEAGSYLQRAVDAHPDNLQPRVLLARLHLAEGKPENVATAFVGLPDSVQQDPVVLQLTATAQLVQREHASALFTLEQLNAIQPDSAGAHYMTALAAAGTGDTDLATRELDRALELEPNLVQARIARARLMARLGEEERFAEDIAILVREAPENGDVLLLQAGAAGREEDYTSAVGYAERAYEKAPVTATVLALGAYREAAGQDAAAQQLYSEWLESNPEDTLVRLKLANETLDNGDSAIEQYRAILGQDPQNVIALNNLAWLLRERDADKSLEYARQAADLAPDNYAVLDTLAVVEQLNGNLDRAMRSIERAIEQNPTAPALLLHRAQIENAMGDSHAARFTLDSLLAMDDEFPERAEAEALRASL